MSDRNERKALLDGASWIERRVSRNHNSAVLFLIRKGYPSLCEPAILCLGAALEDVVNVYLATAALNLRERDPDVSSKLYLLQDEFLDGKKGKWRMVNKLVGGAAVEFPRYWELALAIRNEIAHSSVYRGKSHGRVRPGLQELETLGLLNPKTSGQSRGRFDNWELVAWICTQFDEIVHAFAAVLALPERQLGEELIEFAWLRDNMARNLSQDRNPPLP